ncbi:MAG: hypothetical protein GTO55_02960 [Armatimonadetes bacterium]|nr:hypothetical protein [Armatimonadota bacterium]NIM23236.1 hypothetical protein [Armatimonadota bacterium]NIM67104.1 hypothetical protein [Armatimonadota bacterium]NIM75631.1 hypothetical protein [Armatimonadota bacterium]NIN05293.1 hypothetical protein [Armatimonadota bacterium]
MLRIGPVGVALGITFDILYIVCVAFHSVYDQAALYPAWRMLLPGLPQVNVGSFLIGIVQVFIYGMLIGLIFVPIYNRLARTD